MARCAVGRVAIGMIVVLAVLTGCAVSDAPQEPEGPGSVTVYLHGRAEAGVTVGR